MVPSSVVVKLLHLMLCERKVAVVGRDIGLLSVVSGALPSLLEPLTWECVHIPIKPRSLATVDLLSCPNPFIVGINAAPSHYQHHQQGGGAGGRQRSGKGPGSSRKKKQQQQQQQRPYFSGGSSSSSSSSASAASSSSFSLEREFRGLPACAIPTDVSILDLDAVGGDGPTLTEARDNDSSSGGGGGSSGGSSTPCPEWLVKQLEAATKKHLAIGSSRGRRSATKNSSGKGNGGNGNGGCGAECARIYSHGLTPKELSTVGAVRQTLRRYVGSLCEDVGEPNGWRKYGEFNKDRGGQSVAGVLPSDFVIEASLSVLCFQSAGPFASCGDGVRLTQSRAYSPRLPIQLTFSTGARPFSLLHL